jgi:hypothetical protein
MSYADVVEGLVTQLKAELTGLVSVLPYEPTGINDVPMMYLLFDGADVSHASQVVTVLAEITARLIVRWQDNEEAEKEVFPYIDDVIDAVREDAHLGGYAMGAWVTRIEGAWVTIGQVVYRAIDFTVRVKYQR